MRAAFARVGETRAGWIFDILPVNQRYQLRIVLHDVASFTHQVEISINNTPINHNWEGAQTIRATFPSELMHRKDNIVQLRTELEPGSSRSIAIERIEIEPEL